MRPSLTVNPEVNSSTVSGRAILAYRPAFLPDWLEQRHDWLKTPFQSETRRGKKLPPLKEHSPLSMVSRCMLKQKTLTREEKEGKEGENLCVT